MRVKLAPGRGHPLRQSPRFGAGLKAPARDSRTAPRPFTWKRDAGPPNVCGQSPSCPWPPPPSTSRPASTNALPAPPWWRNTTALGADLPPGAVVVEGALRASASLLLGGTQPVCNPPPAHDRAGGCAMWPPSIRMSLGYGVDLHKKPCCTGHSAKDRLDTRGSALPLAV